VNPYRFARINTNRPPVRRRPTGHDKFSGVSGVLYCELETATPIFIAEQMNAGAAKTHKTMSFIGNRQPFIPGSSLKGVIRSLAEAAGNGCMVLFSGEYRDGNAFHRFGDIVPRDFRACQNQQQLCITCRMFGAIADRQGYLGNVCISDASAREFRRLGPIVLTPLQNPKPRHSAFYRPNNRFPGRKFYYHGNTVTTSREATPYNSTVHPVEGTFDFRVSFTNLADDELSLLLYSLVLEPQMRHKIGMGKPLGLGSIQIRITKAELIKPQDRYSGKGAGVIELSGAELETFIAQKTQPYVSDTQSVNLIDLRQALAWPPQHELRYPTREWFSNNSQAPLSETP
jgi:CRISPR/Cas system CSM-associated protein Csm3 (group 7 of RAMP superfamily)